MNALIERIARNVTFTARLSAARRDSLRLSTRAYILTWCAVVVLFLNYVAHGGIVSLAALIVIVTVLAINVRDRAAARRARHWK